MHVHSSLRAFRLVVLGALTVGMALSAEHAVKFKVLYDFPGGKGGWEPEGTPLYQGGVLYGTTYKGGAHNGGAVYRLNLKTGKVGLLHSFGRIAADGANPQGSLIRDAAGTFYGITAAGGTGFSGTIYQFNVASGTPPVYSVIASFVPNTDNGGLILEGPPAVDAAGNIFGVTQYGSTKNSGTIWKVDTSGKLSNVYSFGSAGDGANPVGGVILENGNLYGATSAGGANGFGTVWEYNIGTSKETVLYHFKGGSDGAQPSSGLTSDGKGHLYGATYGGGSTTGRGPGTIYKVTIASGIEQIQHVFQGSDGLLPEGTLARDVRGNLYGTTAFDGGSAFRLSPSGKLTTLYKFSGATGAGTVTGLTLDPKGHLYGVTRHLGNTGCGGGGCGQIFEITQ